MHHQLKSQFIYQTDIYKYIIKHKSTVTLKFLKVLTLTNGTNKIKI